MLVNNTDITAYKAELLDRAISTTVVHSITDWMDEATEGSLLRQAYDWRNIKLTFLIREVDEDKAYKRISALTEALKKCTLRFDDIELDFPCVLDGTTVPDRLQNGVFKVIFNLKNDWAWGELQSVTYHIATANAKRVHVDFIRNWTPTMESYTSCFDQDEIYQVLGSEDFCIDLALVKELAERNTSWSEFFLELGIPVNKYKQVNDLNGFLNIDKVYLPTEAVALFEERDTFIIYYNRFHKDGYPDFPEGKTYPSLVWQARQGNNYFFDTGIGQGWNIQDISVSIIGRYFEARVASNGGMFGAGDEPYGLIQQEAQAYYSVGTANPYRHKVIEGDQIGQSSNVIIGTLEDISDVPLREYGIKSSNEGNAPIVGYADFLFNGITLTRNPCGNYILDENITIGLARNSGDAKTEPAENCDIARVRIYYKGELVQDLIPIDRSLKNCFINDYDVGFYDVKNMKYVGWTQYGSGNKGRAPNGLLMPIPGMPDTPVGPPSPTTYSVTIVDGTGSGNYEKGALVNIVANPPADNRHVFGYWEITSGNLELTKNIDESPNSFVMPEENVVITAVYIDAVPDTEPQWLLYNSLEDLQKEDAWTVGQYAVSWEKEPRVNFEFVISFSVTGITNVTYYPSGTSGKTLKKISEGFHGNRFWVKLKSNSATSFSGCDITGTYKGETYTKEFSIKSLW